MNTLTIAVLLVCATMAFASAIPGDKQGLEHEAEILQPAESGYGRGGYGGGYGGGGHGGGHHGGRGGYGGHGGHGGRGGGYGHGGYGK